jgi:hypothetical protein
MSMGTFDIRERLHRIAEPHVDEAVEPRLTEVLVRLLVLRRLILAADDDSPTIVLHRRGEVERRNSERGPELDDPSRVDASRDQVEHLPPRARYGNVHGAHAAAEATVVDLPTAEEVWDDKRRDERDSEEIEASVLVERAERPRDVGVIE